MQRSGKPHFRLEVQTQGHIWPWGFGRLLDVGSIPVGTPHFRPLWKQGIIYLVEHRNLLCIFIWLLYKISVVQQFSFIEVYKILFEIFVCWLNLLIKFEEENYSLGRPFLTLQLPERCIHIKSHSVALLPWKKLSNPILLILTELLNTEKDWIIE